MTEQTGLAILHWFWTAFFAGFGVYLLLRPDCMMRTSCRVLRLRDGADRPRVDAAVERRRAVEHISNATGYGAAAFCFVMSAITAVTHVSTGLLYAIFCLGLALTMTALYLQLRNSQPTRIAVLNARTPASVIPVWAFLAAGVSAVCCLLLAAMPHLRVSALVVFASTAVTVFAAWRLTSLPAILQGVDVPVETALDQRLRFHRSAGVFVMGIVQPFVFASQSLDDRFPAVWIAYFVTLIPFFAFAVWVGRRMVAKVSFAQQ
ncbi:MAG TPA: hypothetical protein VFL13_14160 [Candidatus Baltobacteraceae bacterium]|nr:hypothetical protein [Candidatus Baltobacteraceae bacterium]